jgi:hypothetical protein
MLSCGLCHALGVSCFAGHDEEVIRNSVSKFCQDLAETNAEAYGRAYSASVKPPRPPKVAKIVSPVALLKLLQCLRYNLAGLGGVVLNQTLAAVIETVVQDGVLARLPEYVDAAWELA